MIINRKPLSCYFQKTMLPAPPQIIQQQQQQHQQHSQIQQHSLYDQFSNYPVNKMQAWKELNTRITQQINMMIKKKISDQKDEMQLQLLEEKKQREQNQGRDTNKINYLIFSTAKRRSVSTDDLKMVQVHNKFQQNLGIAPKKSILKLDSSYKQRNNYIKTEINEDIPHYPSAIQEQQEERRQQEPEEKEPFRQLKTPDQYQKQKSLQMNHSRYLSIGRASSSSEKKQKKCVQFSDTKNKLFMPEESNRFQTFNPYKMNMTSQSQLNDVTPFTIQSYRSNLSQKLIQHSRPEDSHGKYPLIGEKMQIMDTHFRERLQKKLNLALQKKEELKMLKQMINQPIQITHLQPKQLQNPSIQYVIKMPSRKQ